MLAKRRGKTITVYAESGDSYDSSILGRALCRLRDNNNGWDVELYSFSCTHPHVRLNLDYDALPLLAAAYATLPEDEK